MVRKLYFKHGVIEHEKDIEEFTLYPAPLMELIHSNHFTNINSTIAFFGPMLYFLTRSLLCEKVLEIGSAEGYTAHYLAHAINDNAIRHNYNNAMYYGLDILQTEKVKECLDKEKLPNTLINIDSINLTEDTFKDIKFDMIFQDGAHDKEHVIHEIKTLWPQLKGNGNGYWIFHDTRGPAEQGYKGTLEYFKEKNIDFQHINLDDNIYGLGIFRNMEGFNYSSSFWKD